MGPVGCPEVEAVQQGPGIRLDDMLRFELVYMIVIGELPMNVWGGGSGDCAHFERDVAIVARGL